MRKIIFTITLLTSISVYAQQKVDGMGKFKIGKTTISIVDSILAETNTSLCEEKGRTGYSIGNGICEIIPDTVDLVNNYDAALCPGVRLFHLKDYSIAGIYIVGMQLTFYKDTLIRLSCDKDSKIDEALESKFGKPKVELRDKLTPCGKESGYCDIWLNGNIKCLSCFGELWDDKCQRLPSNFMTITHSKYIACVTKSRQMAAKIKSRKKAPEGF